jgi:hypothetical protein
VEQDVAEVDALMYADKLSQNSKAVLPETPAPKP